MADANKAKENNAEETRIRRVNKVLERLDKMIEDLVDDIVLQNDEESAVAGRDVVIDATATDAFIRKINSLKINGDELTLVGINDRYNKAIKALKDAMKSDDPKYKKQFKNEFDRIIENKTNTKFDAIVETYKEISARLDRGEVQRDYFQDKADKKQAEIDIQDRKYDEKIGAVDEIIVSLEEPAKEINEKQQFKEQYEKLKSLSQDIEDIETELKDPDLDDEEKEEKEEELKKLQEKRKELLEEFENNATDKDGKKYKRQEGKSDKEYIEALDETKIDEAIQEAINKFNNKAKNIKNAKFTILDRNLKEMGETDINTINITDSKQSEKLLSQLSIQKKLWKQRMVKDGYDKAKLMKEKAEFQNKADKYVNNVVKQTQNSERRESTTNDPESYPVPDKFNWRHPFKSIKAMFQRKKAQKKVQKNVAKGYNVDKTKEQALKYLEENKSELQKINSKDKNKKRSNFKDELKYNVSVSEQAINEFWDKETKTNTNTNEKGTQR